MTRIRTEPIAGRTFIVRWAGNSNEADEATFQDDPEQGEDGMSIVLERLGAERIGTSHRGNQKWRFPKPSGGRR